MINRLVLLGCIYLQTWIRSLWFPVKYLSQLVKSHLKRRKVEDYVAIYSLTKTRKREEEKEENKEIDEMSSISNAFKTF